MPSPGWLFLIMWACAGWTWVLRRLWATLQAGGKSKRLGPIETVVSTLVLLAFGAVLGPCFWFSDPEEGL